jgi:hypothetical protein
VTADDIARGLIIGGTVWYALFWFVPKSGRLLGEADCWRTAPRWIRVATQRRDVGVHFYGLLQQAWGLTVLATGIAIVAGARPSGAFVQGEIGAIVVPAIVSIAIRLVRSRRKPHPDDPGAT